MKFGITSQAQKPQQSNSDIFNKIEATIITGYTPAPCLRLKSFVKMGFVGRKTIW